MNAKTSTVATEATWDFTANEDTMAALASAARVVAGRRSGSSEDDLYQEALLYLGVRPQLAVDHPAKIYRHTVRYLEQEERGNRADDLATSGGDPEEWEQEMGLYNNGMQDDPFGSMLYPEELVRVLLEAHWNGWTVVDEFRPDPDMPRSKPNPSRLGTDMAHRVDIGRALACTPLTTRQVQAIRLTIGDGLSQEAAGAGLGISQQAVDGHVRQALYLLCVQLNGVNPEEEAA